MEFDRKMCPLVNAPSGEIRTNEQPACPSKPQPEPIFIFYNVHREILLR